jgi:hypothetical protein
MAVQSDLFTDAALVPSDTSMVSLKIAGGKLSPEQTRFNKLVARVEMLTQGIVDVRALGDAHRPVYATRIPPLHSKLNALLTEMILFLDQRLAQPPQKGFTEKDRTMARELICGLTIGRAQSGDVQMQAIFDAHSDQSVADIRREDAAEAQALFDYVLKSDAPQLDPSATAEDILRAGAERLRERDEARAKKRSAGKAKRTQAARELKGGVTQDDAESVLRTLYRRLASKLHPDRERDPLARERKNALMSQANAAYERRDLMTLLRLQLAIDALDSEAIASMAKETVVAMTHLLKEQVQTLEAELLEARGRLAHEFRLSLFDAFDSYSLARSLDDQCAELQSELSQMEYDVARVKNSDSEFKRWLKEQRKLTRQAQKMSNPFDLW